MSSAPIYLYTKEILNYIDDILDSPNKIKGFNSLDDIEKDHLVALGLEAFNGDIEIVLSTDQNIKFKNFLLSNDKEDQIDFINEVKKEFREKFSEYFDYMIDERISDNEYEKNIEFGFTPYKDKDNGELCWNIKGASSW